MDELIARLRESAKAYAGMLHDGHAKDCIEAADRIEKLEAENARLREKLRVKIVPGDQIVFEP